MAHLRRALPAANCIRFVGLLWHDSVMSNDGLECASDDPALGYIDATCLAYVDALIKQATDAGLWVILAARAKYAAGWGLGQPDVWSHEPAGHEVRRRMLAMWQFIAKRYKGVERIAGYEIMSEPRTKTVSQSNVRDFMRQGCEAVHREDPRALCVVGPRPFYKLWEFNDDILQPPGSNTLYTFDFFVPKKFVMSDTAKETERYCSHGEGCFGSTYPEKYQCKDVYDTWWHGQPGCKDSHSMITVDASFLRRTLEKFAADFGRRHNVPLFCNQWGVKDEVFEFNGRFRYARDFLSALSEFQSKCCHSHATASVEGRPFSLLSPRIPLSDHSISVKAAP